ncbi:DHS-like NAD/FAD-binding domain-containing protein, partial [Lindgomyces ingoldianus]
NCRSIVVISGAGISTKAGIADFRSSSRTKGSSRQVFHISAYSSEESTARLHNTMYQMFTAAERSQPTAFHYYMSGLAVSGKLRRHYTQNIDCLETQPPLLSQKTKWPHGRLDRMICQRCQLVVPTSPDSFQQQALSSCVKCEAADQERLQAGKRSHGVGLLLPKVLLYGGDSPDESDIADSFEKDLNDPVDAVIIVGTRLQIPSLRRLAYRLCEAVKSRGGITLWVSDEP